MSAGKKTLGEHMNKPQIVRLAELDRQIRAGRYPNCNRFAQEWEVSSKTIQRDINFLKYQQGAPLAYDPQQQGYYYTDKSFHLPAFQVTEDELLSLAIGSRLLDMYRNTPMGGALNSVFEKLKGVLTEKISFRPEWLCFRFSFTLPPVREINEKVWLMLIRGLLYQQVLQIRYRLPGQGSRENKHSYIQPYHMANLLGEWYVFGVHRGHEDIRQFAVAKIESAKLLDETFELPDDFEAGEMLAHTFGRFAIQDKVYTIRLQFDKEQAEWIEERVWHPEQKIKKRRNGDLELSFKAKGLYEVQRWVLSWGRWVKVLGPIELKQAVEEEIQHMAAKGPQKNNMPC